MTIRDFIIRNTLRPGDAVVMNKLMFGMLDHYVIYLGNDMNTHEPVFVANYNKGVRWIREYEMVDFLQKLAPKTIDRFPGSENQRPAAVQRALDKIGEDSYGYVSNNCEHFKNYVHYGTPYSNQAESFGEALAITGLTLLGSGLSVKSKGMAWGGLALTALGVIAKNLSKNDNGH